ncbi:MAG TPA: bifunctional ADP-heptose synthase [Terriglobia bacterium]|nr:bifunctional ADP-heptose synthase [Terriglobia bacterium]
MKLTRQVRSSLLSVIRRFSRQHIVVLGDMVADEFVYCEITRVSREAPVLILRQRERKILPGGGANAVNNLADLGAHVTPAGAVGADDAGDALLQFFKEKDVSTRGILRVRGYITPTKSRILGGLTHWQRQQIVRIDREPSPDGRQELRKRLRQLVAPWLNRAQGLLVSDYGYGATSAAEVETLRPRANRRRLPLVIDSRYDLAAYTQVTALTPNEPEVEAVFGKPIGNDLELLFELGHLMLQSQSLQALLITRGRDGMVLFEAGRKPQVIPVFGSDQAVDVTGAGDTVVAVFTLALAAGASFAHAALMANCAGGLVVMKRGTATVSAQELKEAIRNA